jgi:hypothetical protein
VAAWVKKRVTSDLYSIDQDIFDVCGQTVCDKTLRDIGESGLLAQYGADLVKPQPY